MTIATRQTAEPMLLTGMDSSICKALQTIFGTPFSLWRCDRDRSSLAEIARLTGALQTSPENSKQQAVPREDVQDLAAVSGGAVFSLPDRRVVLTVPVEGDRTSLVAAAIIPPAAPDLIRSCVAAAQELVGARSNVSQYGKQLTSYAEQLSDCYEELVWLRELGENVTHCRVTRTMDEVATLILTELRELIRAEVVSLVRTPQTSVQGADIRIATSVGQEELWTQDTRRCIAQFLQDEREGCRGLPVVRNAGTARSLFPDTPAIHSIIAVPVSIDEHDFGWLIAFNRCLHLGVGQFPQMGVLGADEFGTVEATLIQTASSMLATHGQNSTLFHEKEELMLGVVKSLVRSLEARDEYTCGHSDRVALLSQRIAKEMGLDRLHLERIYIAGLLHDIGKVGIPDGVLNKPDRLTDDEFEIIKRHPVIGYDILKNLRQFDFVLPAVRHHHEQMDGRGYPDGLSGSEIPLEARIMAVADAYDAMTSSRPYRDGMPFEKAESILRENRGPQWDPQVLDAFFRRRDEMRALCRQHRQDSVMNHLDEGDSFGG